MNATDIPDEFAKFNDQLQLPLAVKVHEFQRNERLRHLILAAQLTPQLLERLRQLADMIRQVSRTREGNLRLKGLLSHHRAMLYFTQPSTRTFLSFMAACQILGLTCNEVRDPQTSSESKRESRMDSIRMFSSYFDVIIMRTRLKNYAECCAWQMNQLEAAQRRSVPIINAGSGSDEHPTQALLDMYTIQRTFMTSYSRDTKPSRFVLRLGQEEHVTEGPGQKTYLFCGDLGRGRTVRSLSVVLSQYPGVRMLFVSPDSPVLRMEPELLAWLRRAGVECQEFFSLDSKLDGQPVLAQADCLYMTRIQREHNSAADEAAEKAMDLEPFRLTPERASRLKAWAPIMHPFPRDSVTGEIPVAIDTDPRAMYFRQARNGMWARAALLVHLFDAAEELKGIYGEGRTNQ